MEEEMRIVVENDGLNGISNYDALKAWALEQVSVYNGLVVQEDAISAAKSDTAKLRKVAKNASDYRIALKKEHEAKIATTITQLQEITKIFNDAADAIDTQVKSFDEKRKQEKQIAIAEKFENIFARWKSYLTIDKVEALCGGKWMNKGTALETIEKQMKETLSKVENGVVTIRNLGSKYENEMILAFLNRLDLNDALNKKSEIEEFDRQMQLKREAEEERRKQLAQEQENKAAEKQEEAPNPPVNKPKAEQRAEYRLAFEVFGTKEELYAVANYIKNSGLRYKRL